MDLKRFKQRIESVMKAEGKTPHASLAGFLSTASFFYGTAIRFRKLLYHCGLLKRNRLPCRVISIGNITAGGTGKTPMSIYMAEKIRSMGYKVAVISRGYKGRSEKTGGIVGDGKSVYLSSHQAGDEPFLMASALKHVPVLVGKDRYATGRTALETFGSDVIVLDDAYQHLALARDIDFVLLDDKRPFGNHRLIPRGTLREPVSALARADAFIVTRSLPSGSSTVKLLKEVSAHRPVFRSFHVPGIRKIIRGARSLLPSVSEEMIPYGSDCLNGRRVFGFSGIAENSNFKKTIQSFGCEVIQFLEFPDHYRYTERDIQRIFRLSTDCNTDLILTTDKDFVRFDYRDYIWPVDLVVVGVEITMGEDTDALFNYLKCRLETAEEKNKV